MTFLFSAFRFLGLIIRSFTCVLLIAYSKYLMIFFLFFVVHLVGFYIDTLAHSFLCILRFDVDMAIFRQNLLIDLLDEVYDCLLGNGIELFSFFSRVYGLVWFQLK